MIGYASETFNVFFPGPLRISHMSDYVYDFCSLSLSDRDVGPLVLVRDVEH